MRFYAFTRFYALFFPNEKKKASALQNALRAIEKRKCSAPQNGLLLFFFEKKKQTILLFFSWNAFTREVLCIFSSAQFYAFALLFFFSAALVKKNEVHPKEKKGGKKAKEKRKRVNGLMQTHFDILKKVKISKKLSLKFLKFWKCDSIYTSPHFESKSHIKERVSNLCIY